MNDNEIEFVYSKGKRKSEIQKLYDELKKNESLNYQSY